MLSYEKALQQGAAQYADALTALQQAAGLESDSGQWADPLHIWQDIAYSDAHTRPSGWEEQKARTPSRCGPHRRGPSFRGRCRVNVSKASSWP